MKRTICLLLAFCLLAGVGLAEVAPESQSLGLPGVFLRTAALANATEEDIRILQDDYHLSTIVDLRMTAEAESAPDPEIEGVKYLHLGIIDEEEMAAKRQAISAEVMEGLDLSKKTDQLKLAIRLGIISDQMYVEFLSGEPGKAGYARLFRELLALPEGGSLLFHCTQGKDRTGCAAMLILSALGVDEETILADFMLTNAFNAALIESERQMLIAQGLEGGRAGNLYARHGRGRSAVYDQRAGLDEGKLWFRAELHPDGTGRHRWGDRAPAGKISGRGRSRQRGLNRILNGK